MVQINFKENRLVKIIGAILAGIVFLYSLLQPPTWLINFAKQHFFSDECLSSDSSPVNTDTAYNALDVSVLSNETLYQRLEQISTGATNQYVNSLLGEPFLVRRLPKCLDDDIEGVTPIKIGLDRFTERIYTDDRFYLQTISDENNQVLAYALVTRDKKFNPPIRLALDQASQQSINLGQATFRDFESLKPERFKADKVAFGSWNQHAFYLEHYYFGRPGSYKDYLYGVSPYGIHNSSTLYDRVLEFALDYAHGNDKTILSTEDYQSWRSKTIFNAFAIIGDSPETPSRLIDYFFYYGIGPNIEVIYDLN